MSAIDGVLDVESLYDMHVVQRFANRPIFLMLLPPADADYERITRAKKQAIDHPLAAGNLVTTDGRATSLFVFFDPTTTDVRDLEVIIGQIHAAVDQAIRDATFQPRYAGMPEIRVRTSDVVVQDQLIFNVIGALAGMAVNLFLLRRVAAIAIVSAGSWLGVAWAFGIFALLGQPLTPINGIVTPLAMTIGLTDSIHLLLCIGAGVRAGGRSAHPPSDPAYFPPKFKKETEAPAKTQDRPGTPWDRGSWTDRRHQQRPTNEGPTVGDAVSRCRKAGSSTPLLVTILEGIDPETLTPGDPDTERP